MRLKYATLGRTHSSQGIQRGQKLKEDQKRTRAREDEERAWVVDSDAGQIAAKVQCVRWCRTTIHDGNIMVMNTCALNYYVCKVATINNV